MSVFTVGPYGMLLVMPVYIALAIFSYFQIPKKWIDPIPNKIFFVIFHLLGTLSLLSMTIWYCQMSESIFKSLHLLWQTFYFNFILITSVLLGIRLLINFLRKVFTKKGHYKPLDNVWLWSFAVLFVIFYTIVGLYHDENIQETKYDIHSDKNCTEQSMKIAMYSDSHMGAGANNLVMAYATDRINTFNSDIVILDGDIVDGSTSKDDLEYLTDTLKNTKSKYGVYYVWGNHDDNCLFEWEKALTDAGVIILKDEAVKLPNGSYLVGRDDRTDTNPTQILELSGFKHEDFDKSEIIVAQHRPKYYQQFKDKCDLMLSGHTHGYPYPIRIPTFYFSNEMIYGIETFDTMTAITSSGLSTWGFHTKWPSFSEVVETTIHFD